MAYTQTRPSDLQIDTASRGISVYVRGDLDNPENIIPGVCAYGLRLISGDLCRNIMTSNL